MMERDGRYNCRKDYDSGSRYVNVIYQYLILTEGVCVRYIYTTCYTYNLLRLTKHITSERFHACTCTPIPGIKCPSTFLAGRYRLTHGAAYTIPYHTTIITRSACGGWSLRSWFLTMVDKAKGDRVLRVAGGQTERLPVKCTISSNFIIDIIMRA